MLLIAGLNQLVADLVAVVVVSTLSLIEALMMMMMKMTVEPLLMLMATVLEQLAV